MWSVNWDKFAPTSEYVVSQITRYELITKNCEFVNGVSLTEKSGADSNFKFLKPISKF